MITTEQANKLYKLIKKYRDAAVDDSWKGASAPNERTKIRAALNRAVKNLTVFIDELKTAPTALSDSGSVDTPEFRKLEAAYAKAIFDFTDDPSKTNGESMATVRSVFITHIESLTAGMRKDAERYRWLRDHGCVSAPISKAYISYDPPEWADAAVDAAMASHSPATSKE